MSRFLTLFLLLLATAVSAEPPVSVDATLRDQVIEWRRDLHQHPELGNDETRTAQKVADHLRALGLTPKTGIAHTGVTAVLKGARPGPRIALRADMDALPVTERTGLPFASTVRGEYRGQPVGVMHACGHDMHATWAVGAGMLLARDPALGEVRIVLQPAEEVGEGAAAVLASGALDDCAAIFGAHVDWRFAVGEVVVDAGPLAASTDTFEITFHGRGGHGARPQDTIDPVVGLAAFVGDLQTLVSRRLDPALPGVVSVGVLEAGNAPNVIPESARCAGTIRATTVASRTLLVEEVERLAHAVAAAHLCSATVTMREGTPPLVNPPQGAAWAQQAARALLGDQARRSLATANMGGEDFAFYLERMDGCFMRLGTWREGRARAGVHTPRFDPDEDALLVGAALLAACARVASASLSE